MSKIEFIYNSYFKSEEEAIAYLVQMKKPVLRLKNYFFNGLITPEAMKEPGWWEIWHKSAVAAAAVNTQFVVFRLPADMQLQSELVSRIELFLQNELFADLKDEDFPVVNKEGGSHV